MGIGKRTKTLFFSLCILCFTAQVPAVSNQDVSLAMKSVVISSGILRGSSLLTPELDFDHASLTQNGDGSVMHLAMNDSDVGDMRSLFLSADPPQARPMGFFEMLLQSVTSLFPDYFMIREYLERQHLYPGDIQLTGELDATRETDVPFRYQGSGEFYVEGTRVSGPFTLSFTFMIPLEGNQMGMIVPLSVTANDEDFITEARRIFHVQ